MIFCYTDIYIGLQNGYFLHLHRNTEPRCKHDSEDCSLKILHRIQIIAALSRPVIA